MTEYVKHTYSGRIYQVMRDHGPDHPYLWSPWEFASRYPSQVRAQFFRPCHKPETMPTGYDISIEKELEWEGRKLRGSQPIVVRPPAPSVNRTKKVYGGKPIPPRRTTGAFTVQDLALELGCTTGQARAALRKSKLDKPQGGWKWSTPGEAELARRTIKKSLK